MSAERRSHARFAVTIAVDYASGETFLFSSISDISEMGIFIRSDAPMPVGTQLKLRFALPEATALQLAGEVVWVNPLRGDGDDLNPGMGVRFLELTADQREQLVELVHTVAYLRDMPPGNNTAS